MHHPFSTAPHCRNHAAWIWKKTKTAPKQMHQQVGARRHFSLTWAASQRFWVQLPFLLELFKLSALVMPAACIAHSVKTMKPCKCKLNQIKSNQISLIEFSTQGNEETVWRAETKKKTTKNKEKQNKIYHNVFSRKHIHISDNDHIFRSIIYLRLSLNYLYKR